MRFAGAVLIWIGFILTGTVISSLLEKREKVIGQTLVFLNCLAVEIEYSRIAVPLIIEKFSAEKSFDKLTFLPMCNKEMENGADFPSAWANAIEEFSFYAGEEKVKLLNLGSFLGTSDSQGQISTINVFVTFFEQYHQNVKQQAKKYGGIAPMLGVLLGAAVFILLI